MKKKIKIEKSRILLKQALLHLLLEKSYSSISIQELCKEAKVGRSTFYNHYHDKRDLLESTVAYYSQIAQETTLTAFLTDDNMDLRSNLIRDYETTAKYSHVIQALMKVHLPNADFEANVRQILRDKYQVLLENESSIMKLATSPCLKIFVLLSFSKPVISFDNRLETVRLSSQG